MWPNQDEAFLDVARKIRAALGASGLVKKTTSDTLAKESKIVAGIWKTLDRKEAKELADANQRLRVPRHGIADLGRLGDSRTDR